MQNEAVAAVRLIGFAPRRPFPVPGSRCRVPRTCFATAAGTAGRRRCVEAVGPDRNMFVCPVIRSGGQGRGRRSFAGDPDDGTGKRVAAVACAEQMPDRHLDGGFIGRTDHLLARGKRPGGKRLPDVVQSRAGRQNHPRHGIAVGDTFDVEAQRVVVRPRQVGIESRIGCVPEVEFAVQRPVVEPVDHRRQRQRLAVIARVSRQFLAMAEAAPESAAVINAGFRRRDDFSAAIAAERAIHQADARAHFLQRYRCFRMGGASTVTRHEPVPQRADRLFRLPGMQLQIGHAD